MDEEHVAGEEAEAEAGHDPRHEEGGQRGRAQRHQQPGGQPRHRGHLQDPPRPEHLTRYTIISNTSNIVFCLSSLAIQSYTLIQLQAARGELFKRI